MDEDFKNEKPPVVTPESIAVDLWHWKDYTMKQFETMNDALEIMRRDLSKNTTATLKYSNDIQEIKDNTSDMIALLEVFRAGKKITLGLGTLALWVMSFTSAVTLTIQAIRGKLW